MKRTAFTASMLLLSAMVSFGFADIRKEYYKNDRVKSEISYKGVNKDGKYASYYENGMKKETGAYKNNKKNGVWKEWDDKGKQKRQSEWKDGMRSGTWKEWSPETGKLVFELKYKGEKDASAKFWTKEGKQAYDATIVNGFVSKLVVYKDGKKLVGKPGNGVQGKSGRTYRTTIINGQEWMAENLAEKVEKDQFFEGSAGSKTFDELFDEPGYTCAAVGKKYCDEMGYYYNWETAQYVCPEGWHLPSGQEYDQLIPREAFNNTLTIGGGQILGISSWNKSLDVLGFSAIPEDKYWTSESQNNYGGWAMYVGERERKSELQGQRIDDFLQVRCMKNSAAYQKELDESRAMEEGFRQEIESRSGVLKDSRDGKSYRYITIGSRNWMRDNLAFASKNSSCNNNDTKKCEKFGLQYTVAALDEPLGVCPEGWVVATKADYDELLAAAGEDEKKRNNILRSVEWGGLDELGFSAVPTDFRFNNGFYLTSTKGTNVYGEKGYYSLKFKGGSISLDIERAEKYGIRCVEANETEAK